MWPAAVPVWVYELWWAEVVNAPDDSIPGLFREAHDKLFHGSVKESKPVYDRSQREYREGEIIPRASVKKEVS